MLLCVFVLVLCLVHVLTVSCVYLIAASVKTAKESFEVTACQQHDDPESGSFHFELRSSFFFFKLARDRKSVV